MKESSRRRENSDADYCERFLEFIRLFAVIDTDERLFPRGCRVCGKTFAGMSEYLCATSPKGHCLEDCRRLGKAPFMMLYRHCKCGNTLVLTLDEGAFPKLNSFWEMLEREAEESERSLKEVVGDFSDQCDCYLLSASNPCENRNK